MIMQPVTGRPFACLCIACGKRMQTDRERVLADLDGPAFRAYYCEPCSESAKHNEKPAS